MKSKLTIIMLFAVLFVAAHAQTWKIDKSHTNIGFEVKYMVMTTVDGKFGEYDGDIVFDPNNLQDSHIKGTVEVASINTENERRDGHLRGDDFFNAEKYPHIKFESTNFKKTDDGYVAVGDLTIRDVTKKIEIPFELSGPAKGMMGNTRVGMEGSTTINRQDFGVNWNRTLDNGGLLVSDEVKIKLSAQLIKAEE